MRYLMTLPLAALLLTWGFAASASEVYRWTDERGVVHYSDTPPEDDKFERVNVRTGAANREPEPEDTADADATAAPDPATKACDDARRNLIALRSTLEVAAEFDGETRVLSPEERQDQIERNEQLVAIHCESP